MAFRVTNRGMAFRLPDKRAARRERVEVRVPVQHRAVGLDGGDHARHHVVAAESAADLVSNARPGARAEFAQQLPELRILSTEFA